MKSVLVVILLSLVFCVACSPIEQQARNTAAALQGTLVAAQAKYQTSCSASPTQSVCVTINKGVAGENVLITALETYCGWSTVSPPTDPNAKCVPVASAQAGLQAAISNATTLTLEVKGLI
jgi:hypothetical protein